jgi:hypothetical protein
MKENNPIDNYFKSSLERHEVRASPEVWERVVAETESGSNRGAIWYLMRAAVVVLMISIGTWFIIDGPQDEAGMVVYPDIEMEEGNKNPDPQKTEPVKKTTTPAQSDKPTEEEQKENNKSKKVMPIMKQSQSRAPIYVSNEPMVEVDESLFIDDSKLDLATIELDPTELAAYGQARPPMKIKLNQPTNDVPVETEETGTEDDLKTRVYAYANSQFDNIKNGRPLELPRTGKPQLQINLNRLFNN